jgi:single-stranded-DNA-specific exonuclease
MVQVLHNRGLREPRQVQDFLEGRWIEDDPFMLRDMDRAVDVVIRAIKRQEAIAIYGDFDTDGVTATALLVHALTGLGADVRSYIPNRRREGYGLNLDALRRLYQQDVRLVVTVDCGIRAIDEIDRARRGLEFVVTDHHSVGPELPFASAVINPKRADCPYPFKKLAGVGVAFKLAQALIREAPACGIPVHVQERSLLDLAALGTVADMVPLVGENRQLVRQGLEVINQGRRLGVRALLQVARVRPGEVTASSIGFALGPRLNAAGRLGDASLSYELLIASDPAAANQLAAQLDERNRRRQEMTAQAYDLAEHLALTAGQDVPLLFAADKRFVSGIVGLVAGRLTEAYYRPAIVVETGEDLCRGSCRSIAEFHITHALDQCRDLLVRHGGHRAAAGFTVHRQNLDALMERLLDLARQSLDVQQLAPTLDIDASVPLAEMNPTTMEWIQKLEPCGQENPAPLFLSQGVQVTSTHAVGNNDQHLKLNLAVDGQERDAIAFRMGERASDLGDRVDVVYHLEVNDWNGELQLNVQDISPAGRQPIRQA